MFGTTMKKDLHSGIKEEMFGTTVKKELHSGMFDTMPDEMMDISTLHTATKQEMKTELLDDFIDHKFKPNRNMNFTSSSTSNTSNFGNPLSSPSSNFGLDNSMLFQTTTNNNITTRPNSTDNSMMQSGNISSMGGLSLGNISRQNSVDSSKSPGRDSSQKGIKRPLEDGQEGGNPNKQSVGAFESLVNTSPQTPSPQAATSSLSHPNTPLPRSITPHTALHGRPNTPHGGPTTPSGRVPTPHHDATTMDDIKSSPQHYNNTGSSATRLMSSEAQSSLLMNNNNNTNFDSMAKSQDGSGQQGDTPYANNRMLRSLLSNSDSLQEVSRNCLTTSESELGTFQYISKGTMEIYLLYS